jgi:Fucose dissimilation pathway protein FucU
MLRTISKCISSDLMKCMMDMGHSDVLVIADANFPAAAHAKRLIRLPGVEIPELLEAILPYYPLDSFVPQPVALMQHLPEEPTPEIWDIYRKLLMQYDKKGTFQDFRMIERLDFYEEVESAYAIVQTTTDARYANIVLQKGVI